MRSPRPVCLLVPLHIRTGDSMSFDDTLALLSFALIILTLAFL